jgi:hypothetical protein
VPCESLRSAARSWRDRPQVVALCEHVVRLLGPHTVAFDPAAGRLWATVYPDGCVQCCALHPRTLHELCAPFPPVLSLSRLHS